MQQHLLTAKEMQAQVRCWAFICDASGLAEERLVACFSTYH
jgi:hypothetical protein